MTTNPVLALALIVTALATSASAAPAQGQETTRVAEATSPVKAVSAADGEEESGTCSRIRRRLWVEGEGWVVRRITTCR